MAEVTLASVNSDVADGIAFLKAKDFPNAILYLTCGRAGLMMIADTSEEDLSVEYRRRADDLLAMIAQCEQSVSRGNSVNYVDFRDGELPGA